MQTFVQPNTAQVVGQVHDLQMNRIPLALNTAKALIQAEDDTQHMQVDVGTSLVWTVNPDEAYTLSTDGLLPLRITSFDPYHHLLADVYLAEAGQAETYTLPAGCGEVTMTGLVPRSAQVPATSPVVAGWEDETTLVQLNPANLMAHAAIMRPQSVSRIRHRFHESEVGLLKADAVVRRNQILLADEQVGQGWLTTYIQDTIQSLAVRLRRHDGEPATGGTATAEVYIAWGETAFQALSPQGQKVDAQGEALLYYDLLAQTEGAEMPLKIAVRTDDDWIQTALFGLNQSATEASHGEPLSLSVRHHGTKETLGLKSVVRLGQA